MQSLSLIIDFFFFACALGCCCCHQRLMRKIMKNEAIELPAHKSQSFFMHKAKLSKVETQVLKKSSSKLQYFLTKQVQDFICEVQKKKNLI